MSHWGLCVLRSEKEALGLAHLHSLTRKLQFFSVRSGVRLGERSYMLLYSTVMDSQQVSGASWSDFALLTDNSSCKSFSSSVSPSSSCMIWGFPFTCQRRGHRWSEASKDFWGPGRDSNEWQWQLCSITDLCTGMNRIPETLFSYFPQWIFNWM